MVNEARVEFNKLTEDFKIEKQIELAEKYSKTLEERAEGNKEKLKQQQTFWFFDVLFNDKDNIQGYKHISIAWKYLLFFLIFIGILSVFVIDILLYKIIYPRLPSEIKNQIDFVKNLPLYFGSIKITFFSILGYGIFITNKNFSNNRHLYNVYRQKADNLKMFRAFRDTVNDEKLQSEISILIAKTIFEPVETGYIKQSAEGSSIIENFVTKL